MPATHRGRQLLLAPLLTVLLLPGCSESRDTPHRPAPDAATISVVSGDNQTAMRGEPLPEPVVLRVTGADQSPLTGVPVLFAILEGEGSVAPPTAATDADGLVSTEWTVGLGNNALQVSVGDSTLEARPVEVRAVGGCLYRVPEPLDDGWEVASMWDVGLDPAAICDVCDSLDAEEFRFLNSLLIVKNGKLVLDEYPGLEPGRTQDIASVTKSFTSALVGLALEAGHLEGLDTPVFDFFPEYAHLRNPDKDGIRLRHFLSMTAGFEWNESDLPYSDPLNDTNQGWMSGDMLAYLFGKPVVDEPGSRWNYNSGTTFALGAILQRALDRDPAAFAAERLMGPLGITDYRWRYAGPGLPHMSCCLEMRSRDLAKFGQLYLQGGSWNGGQLIPGPWVTLSTASQVGEGHYGYLWWVGSIYGQDFYIAVGFGGQRILNLPGLDMIIVHTSDLTRFNEVEESEDRKARYDSLVKMIIRAALDEPADARTMSPAPLLH